MRNKTVIISIVSHRRGEGVTTLTEVLAEAMARRGHQILVVDADLGSVGVQDVKKLTWSLEPDDGMFGRHYQFMSAGAVYCADVRLPWTPFTAADRHSAETLLQAVRSSDYDVVLVEAAGHYIQVAEPGDAQWHADAIEIDGAAGAESRPEWQRLAVAHADLVLTCWSLHSLDDLAINHDCDSIFAQLETLYDEAPDDPSLGPCPEDEDSIDFEQWMQADRVSRARRVVANTEQAGSTEHGEVLWRWTSAWWQRYKTGVPGVDDMGGEGDLNLARLAAFMDRWHQPLGSVDHLAIFCEGIYGSHFRGAWSERPDEAWARTAVQLDALSQTRTLRSLMPYLGAKNTYRLNIDPAAFARSLADEVTVLLAPA